MIVIYFKAPLVIYITNL